MISKQTSGDLMWTADMESYTAACHQQSGRCYNKTPLWHCKVEHCICWKRYWAEKWALAHTTLNLDTIILLLQAPPLKNIKTRHHKYCRMTVSFRELWLDSCLVYNVWGAAQFSYLSHLFNRSQSQCYDMEYVSIGSKIRLR